MEYFELNNNLIQNSRKWTKLNKKNYLIVVKRDISDIIIKEE